MDKIEKGEVTGGKALKRMRSRAIYVVLLIVMAVVISCAKEKGEAPDGFTEENPSAGVDDEDCIEYLVFLSTTVSV